MSYIEAKRMSRREFLKVGAAFVGLTLLETTGLKACGGRPEETSELESEIVVLPTTLEMPFGGEFIVEKAPHPSYEPPRLNLNKTQTEKLLRDAVRKPTAPIKVSLFPDDWLRIQPDDSILGIGDEYYQSLSQEEKNTFKDGFTTTVYDPKSGIPQGVAVHIAAGRYLREARRGNNMIVQNEFLPEGLTVDPIIALNTTFYHEVLYHALLRNTDYLKQDDIGERKEELAARKGETEWVKDLASKGRTVRNDDLFLIPY